MADLDCIMLLPVLGAFFAELLLWWPLHADSLLIRISIVSQQWWQAATASALAAGCGTYVAAALVQLLQQGLLPTEQWEVAGLADLATVLVAFVQACGPLCISVATALPRSLPVQLVVVAAALCGIERTAIAWSVCVGRCLVFLPSYAPTRALTCADNACPDRSRRAIKCCVVARCAVVAPEWLVRLGLGSELTRARCGGKAALLPI